jgi:AcrR family transcriptional regulator
MTDHADEPDEAPTGRLARSQHARRGRIAAAVLELASEGGYDAVQVRDVAERADVALGTIYNYYGSRENLIYETMIEWRRQVAADSVASVSGRTLEARLLSLLRHTFESYADAPMLFETFTRIGVRAGEGDPWTHKIQVSAMDEVLEGTDPVWADDFRLILGWTVYAGLSLAGNGQIPVEEVWRQIQRVVKRLVASRPDAS